MLTLSGRIMGRVAEYIRAYVERAYNGQSGRVLYMRAYIRFHICSRTFVFTYTCTYSSLYTRA